MRRLSLAVLSGRLSTVVAEQTEILGRFDFHFELFHWRVAGERGNFYYVLGLDSRTTSPSWATTSWCFYDNYILVNYDIFLTVYPDEIGHCTTSWTTWTASGLALQLALPGRDRALASTPWSLT